MATTFEDPAYRANLTPAAYELERAAAARANAVGTVSGHELRYVHSRFGRLVHVGKTAMAFSTIDAAREYAIANPAA